MDQMRYYQHGDCLLVSVASIPKASTVTPLRILAEGETTGHAHRLLDESDVEVYEYEGTLFFHVGPRGAQITHEEHGLGVIAPGEYQVGHVQEYDHFAEEARAVRD